MYNKLSLIKLISQPLSGTSIYEFCKTLYTKDHTTVENCLQNSKQLIGFMLACLPSFVRKLLSQLTQK